jgi:uncharacterized membrane protein
LQLVVLKAFYPIVATFLCKLVLLQRLSLALWHLLLVLVCLLVALACKWALVPLALVLVFL